MDPLSYIGSGIALYQLLQSIKELVDIGLAVKDAPPKITVIFNSLQLLADAIGRVQEASNVVEFDETSKRVLQDCQKKVSSLLFKIERASDILKSTSKRRRTWQALKSTLEGNETASLRIDIEEIKSTLQLVLESILLESTASIKSSQKKVLTEVKSIHSLFHRFAITMREPRFNSGPLKSGNFQPSIVSSIEQDASLNSAQVLIEPAHTIDDFSPDQVPTVIDVSRRSQVKTREHRAHWSRNIIMPSFGLQIASHTYAVKTIRETRTIETTETETKCIVTPNALGRLLGISRGMTIEASSTTGWKYSIQPFRAVPEDSLIFEFCRQGNLDAVRAMFQGGNASPWDRDPQGRTPLWVAAENLQLEVAELLLDQGADPHAYEWRRNREPIFATVNSKEISIRPKLAMINMLQKYSHEDYRDETYLYMAGLSMLAYRPQKQIEMEWSQRRDAIHQLLSVILPKFHPKHPDVAKIFHGSVMFYYEKNVLQRLLHAMEGPIDVADSTQSIVYEALTTRLLHRDRASMKLIMQRTKRLHLVVKKTESSRDRGEVIVEMQTPSMLAMYDMDTFLEWRKVLRELGHDMKVFIEQELREDGGLWGQAGWDKESLMVLFEGNVERGLGRHKAKVNFGFPACERCGDEGTVLAARSKVDLAWRRRLRDVRLRRFVETPVSAVQEVGSGESLAIIIELGSGDIGREEKSGSVIVDEVFKDEVALPYRIVCSNACRDGVCVAWAFEGSPEEVDNFVFPAYPQEPKEEKHERKASDFEGRFQAAEVCPTRSMPGAFVD